MPDAGNTSAGFTQGEQVDRSAAALGFQRYQMGLNAKGTALGMGRRVVPEASALFSSPPTPMSGAQFGSGHAKSQLALAQTNTQEDY